MPYGSDAWGSSAWSQYEDSGKMGKAVAVGQDKAGKCLVVFFDPDALQWRVVGCFPSVTGILTGCYSDGLDSLWVAGRNGITGTTYPILYHWNGSEWENHATAFTDAAYFYRIAGSGPNNIYVSGSSSTVTPGTGNVWHWDGASWSSKLLVYPEAGQRIPEMSVSPSGVCYICDTLNDGNFRRIRRSDMGWAVWRDNGANDATAICVVDDDNVAYSDFNGGIAVKFWNGTSWGDTGAGSGRCYGGLGAASATDFVYALVGDIRHYKDGVVTSLGPIFNVTPWSGLTGLGRLLYRRTGAAQDIWAARGRYGTYWTTIPVLSHWEGGTTWSAKTDYNVGNLNAEEYGDVTFVDDAFSFSSITPENDVVAVGRDNSGNCLVATFTPSTWTRRTELPTITGHLFSVCAPYDGVFWVAGGTGALGQTSPLLYYWNGSTFVDHSTALTDAVSLWSIECQGPDNVWVVGKATGALDHGAWHFDGSGWTSTKVNTIAVGRGDLANSIFCSVSAEGNCYISSWLGGTEQKIFNNLATPGFVEMFYCDTICGTNPIYATADDQIRVSLGNGGYVSRKYDGISWTYSGSLPGGSYASCLGVLDFANWFWVEASNGVGSAYRVGLAIEKIANTRELATNLAGRLFISRTDGRPDIWVSSGVHDYGRWVGSGIAQLTHWKGCTEWSGPSEYDVAALDAQLWHDLASSSALPPLPSRETLTIAPGAFYIDRVRLT